MVMMITMMMMIMMMMMEHMHSATGHITAVILKLVIPQTV
jgi:hypothetical protein